MGKSWLLTANCKLTQTKLVVCMHRLEKMSKVTCSDRAFLSIVPSQERCLVQVRSFTGFKKLKAALSDKILTKIIQVDVMTTVDETRNM